MEQRTLREQYGVEHQSYIPTIYTNLVKSHILYENESKVILSYNVNDEVWQVINRDRSVLASLKVDQGKRLEDLSGDWTVYEEVHESPPSKVFFWKAYDLLLYICGLHLPMFFFCR